MSALSDRISEVLQAHQMAYATDRCICGFSFPDYDDTGAWWAAHVAEGVEAELGLTEECAEIPTWSDTDEMVPNRMVQGPDMVPKRRMDFVPSRRWVSPWEPVQTHHPA
jgi:hypothetical protein